MNPQRPISVFNRHVPSAVDATSLRADRPLNWLVCCFLFFTLLICATEAVAQSEQNVVAKIGGRVITQQEVDNSIADQLRPLEEQIYALRQGRAGQYDCASSAGG